MTIVKSHKLGPGSLKFGATGSEVEFAASLKSCKVTVDVSEGDLIPVLSGDELEDGDTETYSLSGSLLQQYDLDSLLVWAHVNAGIDVPFVFIPDSDKQLSVSGTVRVRRLDIGGDVKTRNTSDFTWKGKAGTMYDLNDTGTSTPITVYDGTAAGTAPDGSAWF